MGIQKTFKALSDSTRREILELLKEGAVSAGELVSDEKRGKFVYYELNMSVIDDIIRWMTAFQGGNPNEK